MPIMDGYEATRQIIQLYNKWKSSQRVTDKKHNLKVVAITSFTNDEAIKNAYDCGMAQVLNKPVDANQVKAILDKYYYPQVSGINIDPHNSRK
jgi:CheY-like chemotaxis protein